MCPFWNGTNAGVTTVPRRQTVNGGGDFPKASYAVVFVEPNDVLNVRSGPGVDFGIVGELPSNASDVQITGSGQLVAGSTWVPVQRGNLAGWVNSRFLAQFVPEDAFCTDLLETAESACNEILHGGTADFVILPDTHAPINYYSFYRPDTEEFAELNWGSWVVGLELWQGQYYFRTLVHYQWEP